MEISLGYQIQTKKVVLERSLDNQQEVLIQVSVLQLTTAIALLAAVFPAH